MTLMKHLKVVSHQIFDIVQEIKDDDYRGFNYPYEHTDSKTYDFTPAGRIFVEYMENINELHLVIYEGNSEDYLIDIGISIDRIESEKDIIDSVKEELELIVGHYEMMIDELAE